MRQRRKAHAQVNLADCLATLGLNVDARATYTVMAAHSLPGIHPWFEEAVEEATALADNVDVMMHS